MTLPSRVVPGLTVMVRPALFRENGVAGIAGDGAAKVMIQHERAIRRVRFGADYYANRARSEARAWKHLQVERLLLRS